ncbi:MAG: hypothetical protein OXH60_12500 [Rhodospirillales bacterium]|nr:hypothetical protein [Rhodospirillales bacterium]
MTKHRVFTKSAVAAALVSATLVSTAPAQAGPAAAAGVALYTAEVCGPATVATGPWGLLCFAGGGLLSVITVFAPTP